MTTKKTDGEEPFELPVQQAYRAPVATEDAHAYFSPSASSRWLKCTRAPLEEAGKRDSGNAASRRGTKLHGVSELILLGGDAKAKRRAKAAFEALDTDADRDAVEMYVKYVRDRVAACGPGAVLKVEARTKFHPKSWGTSDAVIIDDRRLVVIDAKFGAFPVWASYHDKTQDRERPNSQAAIYGLGALKKYDVFEFDEVELVIVQPVAIEKGSIDEPSTYTISVEALVAEGEGYVRDGIELPDEERVYAPSEDTCRWCKAKTTCAAFEAFKNEAAHDMFGDVVPPEFAGDGYLPDVVTPTDVTLAAPLHRKLALVPLLRQWCKAQEQEAETLLMLGEEVKGFKVVRGNKPARKWAPGTASEEAENAAIDAGVEVADLYNPASLRTPTQIEKALKTAGLKPKAAKELLEEFVSQGEGRLVVVEESNKKPAVTAAILAAADFEGVEQDESEG